MKLILTSEVPGLGIAGDVVDVKPGYGRNFLIPSGFATPWTKGGEKQVADIKRARKAREVRDLAHAKEIKASLEAAKVRLASKAGESGRLFGSITSTDIVAAVKAAGGPSLDKRKVQIGSPIKATGTHKVVVNVLPGVDATVTLDVVPA